MFAAQPRGSILLAVLFAGWTGNPYATAADPAGTVQGKVTLDGQPVAGGRIILYVGGDQFVGAKLKADGTYRLGRVPPGEHRVVVEAPGVPAKFASEKESALAVKVVPGENSIDIVLLK